MQTPAKGNGRAEEPPTLEARGAWRRYDGGVVALRDVDLRVGRGEFLAVLGRSGSGKSTLLHALGGLDRLDEGDVWLEGRPLATVSELDLALLRRRRLGFVLQFFNLLPTLTAIENVAFPLLLDRVSDAAARARQALELVGLGARADHVPAELSGGEQQRVAVARALVTAPAAILADEPTGNLDSVNAGRVLGLLRGAAERGETIVMVTHDEDAARYADRVVRMADGELVERGGPRP